MLIALVGTIVYFYKDIIKYFNKQPIESVTFISNHNFTSLELLNLAIAYSHNQDKAYLDFNTKNLINTLTKYNWIKSVSVKKIWPNRLIVNIVEFKPYVNWTNGLQQGYLNVKGKLFYSPQQVIKNTQFKDKYLTSVSNLVSTNTTYSKPSISLDFNNSFPLIISNQKYIPIGFNFAQHLAQLFNNYNLTIKQVRINSVNSWELLLSNGVILKLDNYNIEDTLKRYLLAAKQIPVPQDYLIGYIDLRYNNGFAIKFINKEDLTNNPNLLIKSLAPGYGGDQIPSAMFAPSSYVSFNLDSKPNIKLDNQTDSKSDIKTSN